MEIVRLPAAALELVTMATMAHEQQLASLRTLQERDKAPDGRWPVPYTIVFTTIVSAALWAMIIVAGSWLM